MYTIKERSELTIIVKKSRFIAICVPASSEEKVLEFIRSESHADATHNCWAWKCGNSYRFTDDGEPGGTAGKPIFSVIEGRELDNIAILVIRYFGGIKLGAGGLVRAYSGTAAKCIDKSKIVEIIPMLSLNFKISIASSPALTAFFNRKKIEYKVDYAASFLKKDVLNGISDCMISISCPVNDAESIKKEITDFTRGEAVFLCLS